MRRHLPPLAFPAGFTLEDECVVRRGREARRVSFLLEVDFQLDAIGNSSPEEQQRLCASGLSNERLQAAIRDLVESAKHADEVV